MDITAIPGLSLSFSLTPPQQGSDQTGVTLLGPNGKPIGGTIETTDPGALIAAQLGFPSTDSIGSALGEQFDTMIQNSGATNLTIQFGVSRGDDALQMILNGADPSNPSAPIDTTYFNLSQFIFSAVLNSLTGGNASGAGGPGGVGGAGGAGGTTGAGGASGPPSISGNPWLAGSMYVTLLEDIMELFRALRNMQSVMGEVEVKGMQSVESDAMAAAHAQIEAAKTQVMTYIVGAVMAACSIAISLGCLAGAAKSTNDINEGSYENANIPDEEPPKPTDSKYTNKNDPNYDPSEGAWQRDQSAYNKKYDIDQPNMFGMGGEEPPPPGTTEAGKMKAYCDKQLQTYRTTRGYSKDPVTGQESYAFTKGDVPPGAGPPAPTPAEIDRYSNAKKAWESKHGVDEARGKFTMYQSGAGVAQGISQFGTNIVNAMTAEEIAWQNVTADLFKCAQQIAQQVMSQTYDQGVKGVIDMITQLLQMLDSIRQKLADAVASILKKSG